MSESILSIIQNSKSFNVKGEMITSSEFLFQTHKILIQIANNITSGNSLREMAQPQLK